MDGWMDGWMDMGRWIDGCMNLIVLRMDEPIDEGWIE